MPGSNITFRREHSAKESFDKRSSKKNITRAGRSYPEVDKCTLFAETKIKYNWSV